MFNACLKDQRFIDIISVESYSVEVETSKTETTNADKEVRQLLWFPTNFYSLGLIEDPKGCEMIGGKTGTAHEAGCCVVLYGLNSKKEPFITVSMGAKDRDILYSSTSYLIETGNILQ